MTRLEWDKVGERFFETGVDRGVLYVPTALGVYSTGFAWNGLTKVTEKPSGAASTPFFADNIKYLNLTGVEEFGADIEAHTYPKEFAQFDGSVIISDGVVFGQQARRTFGLSYRTRVGNDVAGADLGYKLHLVYGCQVAPSDRAYTTVNDKPEALSFNWVMTTNPVTVAGLKPVSLITVDSTKVTAAAMTSLENKLWGDATTGTPTLPLPSEIITIFGGAVPVA